MVKLIVFSFLVFFFIQGGRSEQQQHADFQEVVDSAKKFFDGLAKDLKEKVGLSEDPSGQEIMKVIKDHNERLAQNLKETGKKIEEQLKSHPEFHSAIENLKQKLNEEAEKVKKSNPDLVANAENLGKSLQGTWDSLTKEVEKSYQEFNKAGGKREELERSFGSLLDKLKAGAKELENKIEELQKKTRR